jgi:hypothetical protein
MMYLQYPLRCETSRISWPSAGSPLALRPPDIGGTGLARCSRGKREQQDAHRKTSETSHQTALSPELNLVAPRLEVRAQVRAEVAARHVRNASLRRRGACGGRSYVPPSKGRRASLLVERPNGRLGPAVLRHAQMTCRSSDTAILGLFGPRQSRAMRRSFF